MPFWKRRAPAAAIPPLTFADVQFYDQIKGGRVILALLALYRKTGSIDVYPTFRVTGLRARGVRLWAGFGYVCGLTDPLYVALLEEHSRRLLSRGLWASSAYVLTSVSLFGAYLYAFLSVSFALLQRFPGASPIAILGIGSIVQITFALPLVAIAARLAGLLTDRHYADSLCVAAILVLNVELRREGVLEYPELRLGIVRRLRALQRATQLLPLRCAGEYPESRERLRQHFRAIAEYLNEREHWASVPGDRTLPDLRRDVVRLTEIYLTGRYGAFTWSGRAPGPEVPRKRYELLRGVVRGLGFAVPLAVLLYALINTQELAKRSIPPLAVGSLFMAWLLLGLDNLLGLGVVANLVSVAKGIKELK